MIAVLSPFPTLRPEFGGAERIDQLASRTGHDTTVVTVDWHTDQTVTTDTPHYRHVSIGTPDRARPLVKQFLRLGLQTMDAIPHLLYPVMADTVGRVTDDLQPDLFIVEHPWLIDYADGTPFLHDSHNDETGHARARFGPTSLDAQHTAALELRAVTEAAHWTYCSTDDYKTIDDHVGITQPATHIPNGVTLPNAVSDGTTRNLLFVGSNYGPNIAAARRLIALAGRLPNYRIDIAGAVGHSLTNQPPANVRIHGHVSTDSLDQLYRQAFAFVNLTTEGSGTHLKVGRALAYGVPVITTTVGARGYDDRGVIITPDPVAELTALEHDWEFHADRAREQASELTWDSIGYRWRHAINRAMTGDNQ